MADLTARIRAFAGEYGMLRAETVIACVSGGADSMALLHVLRALQPEYGYALVCAHFDHRLRGGESDRDREFVRKYCADNGIDVKIGYGNTTKVSSERGTGIEETARELRYAFFRETAALYGNAAVVTAHNADDNLETMLLNLARGSGSRGLAGIPPKRGVIERPMLCVTRADIEEYLRLQGIPHVEDSTNASPDMARNKLRHAVVPVLREINPRIAEHALNASRLLREDDAFITRQAETFLRECAVDGGIPVRELSALEKPVAVRVIAVASGLRFTSEHMADVLALCGTTAGVKSLDLPGAVVRRERGTLKFLPPKEKRRKKNVKIP